MEGLRWVIRISTSTIQALFEDDLIWGILHACPKLIGYEGFVLADFVCKHSSLFQNIQWLNCFIRHKTRGLCLLPNVEYMSLQATHFGPSEISIVAPKLEYLFLYGYDFIFSNISTENVKHLCWQILDLSPGNSLEDILWSFTRLCSCELIFDLRQSNRFELARNFFYPRARHIWDFLNYIDCTVTLTLLVEGDSLFKELTFPIGCRVIKKK